jgi:hypothetical protein
MGNSVTRLGETSPFVLIFQPKVVLNKLQFWLLFAFKISYLDH